MIVRHQYKKQNRRLLPHFNRGLIARFVVFFALSITIIDAVYLNVMGIHQQNKELCILYSSMPRWMFLAYEYIFEFGVVVLLGVFAGVMIEQNVLKVRRFFPHTQILAFIYASVLPVCSCGVVPVIEAMKKRVPLRVIISFVIAAPLLNPYIIFLSFSVLGLYYGLIRIIASFLLTVATGWLVEIFARRFSPDQAGKWSSCSSSCSLVEPDPFIKTIHLTRKLLPYILVGGAISWGLEFLNPKQFLETLSFSNQALSMVVMVIVGVPLYVCNGADVLLLKPLLAYTDLSIGSAMVFSLTSSAVCISSIVMLERFLGRNLTVVLLVAVVVITILMGLGIDLLISVFSG